MVPGCQESGSHVIEGAASRIPITPLARCNISLLFFARPPRFWQIHQHRRHPHASFIALRTVLYLQTVHVTPLVAFQPAVPSTPPPPSPSTSASAKPPPVALSVNMDSTRFAWCVDASPEQLKELAGMYNHQYASRVSSNTAQTSSNSSAIGCCRYVKGKCARASSTSSRNSRQSSLSRHSTSPLNTTVRSRCMERAGMSSRSLQTVS